MTTPFAVRRRDVLRLLAALGGAGFGAGAGVGAGAQAEAASRETLVAARVRLRLVSPESASLLGAAYLRDRPDEDSPAHLAVALGLDAGATDIAAIAARHRDDLRSGRVHRLDGFGFSRTELRLCALLYLTDRA
ncbi:MAG: hypothetical protein FJ144_06145 [Deltaproteobacteria bacterium]|nr:hypothetical protein [Deltaproteobacteria bacterium]